MIVVLSPSSPAELTDLERLDRLHATSTTDLDDVVFPAWCHPDDAGEHVWLDVAACRALGASAMGDEWSARYDAMIDYAVGKGWADPSRARVRAHVERTDRPAT